jgi:hypothetical protein
VSRGRERVGIRNRGCSSCSIEDSYGGNSEESRQCNTTTRKMERAVFTTTHISADRHFRLRRALRAGVRAAAGPQLTGLSDFPPLPGETGQGQNPFPFSEAGRQHSTPHATRNSNPSSNRINRPFSDPYCPALSTLGRCTPSLLCILPLPVLLPRRLLCSCSSLGLDPLLRAHSRMDHSPAMPLHNGVEKPRRFFSVPWFPVLSSC